MNRLKSYRVTLTVLGLFGLNLAMAAAEFEHEPLALSAALDFPAVFAAALDNAPEQLSQSARQAQTDAYRAVGDRLFRGQPQFQASYIDDQPIDAVGLREIEAGLQFMLWRPGERRQAAELGRHYQTLETAWSVNLELEVAGRVRASLMALQAAESELALQREALAAAEELIALTQVLYEADAVPQLDVMQAQTLMLAQRQEELAAEAAMVDAERDYEVLTNLRLRPDRVYQEQLSTLEEIPQDHPLLRVIAANLNVAHGTIEQVRRRSAVSPTLNLGVRRERGSRLQDPIDALGIGFSIPLGRSREAEADVSDARLSEAELLVALRRARLQLEQQLHEVEHQINVTRQQLVVSESAYELSQQRWQMARAAYELGEIDLLAVQLALQERLRAGADLLMLENRLQSLFTQYNQTLGILP